VWGRGVGGWGPPPKSPIPNPQSPIPILIFIYFINIFKYIINYLFKAIFIIKNKKTFKKIFKKFDE
jgi:hypothetical protein